MGKILVLAEKPSVAKELARVLGCKTKRDGYIEGDKYIVTWALGHLVTLADPEEYNSDYKRWSLETLPMMPDKLKLSVIKETSKQYKIVSSLLKSESVSELIIATDSGREGELVARFIINKARVKKPMKRLWISSQTDKAIKEGFANARPSAEYDNLYYSALSRAEADWLVGLNVTRALTCKHNAQLSAGRVQTPTLAMIVMREEEIRKFIPKEFYGICASLETFNLHWRGKDGSAKTFDKSFAENLSDSLLGKDALIVKVEKKEKKEAPPLLYDLTELQRDGNRRFGYSAKKTLSIMQKLYEYHKLLTYPRTDSKYISDDIVPSLQDRVKSVCVGHFKEKANFVLKNGIKPSKRFVDSSKVSDHHAIIPTEQFCDLSVLTSEELNIYTLVVTRFLAALSPDCISEKVNVEAEISGERFVASGSIIKEEGFRRIFSPIEEDEPDEEKEQRLPSLKEGDTLKIKKITITTSKTKAPSRYTEATLLTAMEHPGSFVSDKELKKTLESSGGLGTPATRADIIEKIFNTGYAEKQGQSIIPTSKGIQLIKIVPEDLKSPLLTAKWEKDLQEISQGKLSKNDYIENMRHYTKSLVSSVIMSNEKYRHENLTSKKCPLCEGSLMEVSGKHGKRLVCVNTDCSYRESITKTTNARCPECHKKMDVIGDGEKKIYICKCGFKQKFDVFNKVLSEQKKSLNKREVASYLRKQEAEKFSSTSLSDALSGIKLD